MRTSCLPLFLLLLQSAFVCSQNPVACITNQAPGADACADACLHCFLNGRSGQTAGYTANPAPGFCGTVENDQWFGFVAAISVITIEVTPSNCQSGDGIEIALYQNCSNAPLACAAGQPGGGNVTRTLTANLGPGQTYFLMVDGYSGDQCAFQLTTTPTAAVQTPPVTSGGPIQGPAVVAPFSTLKYSIPPVPGATAYRWTGPADSKINGQNSPVTLPAPSGNQVTVTFSDQDGVLCATPLDLCAYGPSCLNIAIGQSDLAAPCPANNYPAADLCADACVFCNFNGYAGTTAGYTAQTPPGFCSGAQNEQWLAFVAGATSGTFTCTPSNCTDGNGIQLALYASCDATEPIACNGGQQGGGDISMSISANTLVPGATYYLVIDSYGGDICDFQLSVSPPAAAVAIPLGPTGPITGPTAICPNGTFNYSITPVSGAGAYNWAGPPGSTINGRPSPVTLVGAGGTVAQVTFGTVFGPVCVQPVNSCFTGTQVCKQVTLTPIPVTNLPPVTICAEDAPYYTPWGHQCPTPGSYCTTLTSSQGCDSVVCIQVNIRAPITFIHAPKILCAGDSVVICGEAFRDVGNHVKICESYLGCDSTVYQSIVGVLNPKANILPDQNLLCTDFPLMLNSAPSPGTKTWSTLSGQVLGTGNSITVTTPDTYVLTTTATAGGNTCEASDTIQVLFGILEATAAGGTITCTQPSVQLDAAVNPAGLQLLWSGPSGFSSDQEDPVVTQPGMYVLVATDPATGCTVQATAVVPADVAAPSINLPPLALNCTTPDITLICPVMPSAAECLWSGPGIATPIPNPVISQGGIYLLTVTYLMNGCTSSSEMTVTTDFQIPVITAYADTITCLNTTTTIHCAVDIPMSVCEWTGIGPNYFVTATAPNGCTATATVSIAIDVVSPNVSLVQVVSDQNGQGLGGISISVVHAGSYTVAWYRDSLFVSAMENISGLTAGNYTVVVTGSNGCTSTLVVPVPDTGVSAPERLNDSRWVIFPNPTNDRLFLRYLGPGIPEAHVFLLDATGRAVLEQTGAVSPEITLFCSHLPPGVYTVLLLSQEGALRRMAVIQK